VPKDVLLRRAAQKRYRDRLRAERVKPSRGNCQTCGAALRGQQTHFCSRICQNASTNTKHQVYEHQKSRGILRKIELIEAKGGACERCGYRANYAALCFHHRGDKAFALTMRDLSNRTREVLLAEAAKCDLLCHNCHMEEHHPTLAMPDLQTADSRSIKPA
jgi:hypothetical protein